MAAPTSWEAGKDMVSEPGDTDEHLSVWRDSVPSRSEKMESQSELACVTLTKYCRHGYNRLY